MMRSVLAVLTLLLASPLATAEESYTRASAIAAVQTCIRNIHDQRCNEDAAGHLIALYHDGDKTLLPLLVRAGVNSDGALAEALGSFYQGLLRDSPRALLNAIAKLPRSQQQRVILLGVEGDGSGIPEDDRVAIQKNLEAIAKGKSTPAKRMAVRTLEAIEAARRSE